MNAPNPDLFSLFVDSNEQHITSCISFCGNVKYDDNTSDIKKEIYTVP